MSKHFAPRPLRAAVFFAKNPDELLTAEDAAIKFDIPLTEVHASLRGMVKKTLLSYSPLVPGKARPMAYGAGPVLLAMIGVVHVAPHSTMGVVGVMQACAPHAPVPCLA